MGTCGNTTTEFPHTRAKNLHVGKVVGNKRHRLSGDITFAFKKLIESS